MPYHHALLRYHMVLGDTLYSNSFYHGKNEAGESSVPIGHRSATTVKDLSPAPTSPSPEATEASPPQRPAEKIIAIKGKRTFPLQTMIDNLWIHVEIARFGGVISMRVAERQAAVVVHDILASDGVIHVVNRVLLPPSSTQTTDAEDKR